MARRQRIDPLEKRVGAVVGFIGFAVFAAVISPGFRSILVLGVLMGGIVLLLLICATVLVKRLNRNDDEHHTRYLGRIIEPTFGQPRIFTKEILDALEWRRFEQLVTWYLEKKGFVAMRSRVGPDGGVDIKLYKNGDAHASAYVQCKAWHVYNVGIKPIRELVGVMTMDGIPTGYFYTTGEFTAEVNELAQGRGLIPINGTRFLADLNSLPEVDRSELLRLATEGDYTTPTCPRCDIKMVRRVGSTGEFWGCLNYSRRPSCRLILKSRRLGD
jgi:hypothetical protein